MNHQSEIGVLMVSIGLSRQTAIIMHIVFTSIVAAFILPVLSIRVMVLVFVAECGRLFLS